MEETSTQNDLIVRTYKYRLYLSTHQEQTLELWGKWCRQLYNLAIEQRRMTYAQSKKSLSWQTQSKELPLLKQAYGKYSEVPAGVFEFMLKQLDQAYKKYYDNLKGYKQGKLKKFPQPPKFKSFKDDITLTHMRSNGYDIEYSGGKFARIFGFPKTKEGLRVRYHRPIDGNVLGQKITRQSGKWYLCVTIEKPKTVLNNTNAIGVDLGVSRSIQLSTGENDFFDLPKAKMQVLLDKKKVMQRRLKKKRGGNRNKKERQSNNYRKAYAKITKIDAKIANIRKYHLQMYATQLARENGAICVENLKVKNMTRSAKGTLENPGSNVRQKSGLNRSLLNLSPYFLKSALKNKAEEFGAIVIEVPPQYTSQTCSGCGHRNTANRVSQSEFCCQECGYSANADFNAAVNILNIGIEKACTIGK